jgi:hypothetical protein
MISLRDRIGEVIETDNWSEVTLRLIPVRPRPLCAG